MPSQPNLPRPSAMRVQELMSSPQYSEVVAEAQRLAAALGDAASRAASAEAAAPSPSPRDSLVSDADVALGRRLHAEWNQPPSYEHAEPTLVVESPTAKCWKYREPGREYDTYTFECTISDCSVESFIAMTSDINTRASWDANCLKIEALAIAGPQTLRKLHGQDGDSMTVQWVAKSPFPLKNREYLMQRDLAILPPARAGGGPLLYFKADRSSTPDELAALGAVPPLPRGANRVDSYWQVAVAWAGDEPGSTCVRCVYREDPMMRLPGWLLSWLMDKLMPSAIESLKKAAREFEQRQGLPN